MAMQRRQEDDGMITKVVSINRVSKTVKGGRVMKFAALIVVGDGKGNIGYGVGKSGEVPEAIRKGEGAAKKNMRKVCLKGTTIPHEIVGEFGAGRVLMRPAAPGTGVLAGGPVPCRARVRRHQGHPRQEPAFQQPHQRHCCYLRRPVRPDRRRERRGQARQDCCRDSGLRRVLQWRKLPFVSPRA